MAPFKSPRTISWWMAASRRSSKLAEAAADAPNIVKTNASRPLVNSIQSHCVKTIVDWSDLSNISVTKLPIKPVAHATHVAQKPWVDRVELDLFSEIGDVIVDYPV